MRRSPCVGLPCHAIDSGRTVTREREIAPLEEVGGDVMQQGREPYSLALPRRSAHGASPFDAKITKHYRGKLQNRDQGHEPAQSRDPQWRFLQHYQRQYVSATIGRGNGQNGFQVGCGVNFK
jgi:hypothetical protein